MSLPPEQLIRVLARESFHHRKLVTGLFVGFSLLMLAVGLLWPSPYVASTTILVKERDIIQPLMQGAAVPTGVEDRAKIARDVLFSNTTMHEVMASVGWLKNHPSPVEEHHIADALRARTKVTVTSVGNNANLIRIEYRDVNPQRAYATTKKFAALFIAESRAAKLEESRRAFNFIDAQAEDYHAKLVDVEDKLRAFRSANVGVEPIAEPGVNTRLGTLQDRIEQTTQVLQQAEAQKRSLEKQLSGEAGSVSTITRGGQYLQRIAELQQRLDTLRLSYHDTYPDIIRVKHQIDDLKEALAADQRRGRAAQGAGVVPVGNSVMSNPVYIQLSRDLSRAETRVAVLKARIAEYKQQFAEEVALGKRAQGSEETLAALTRSYQAYREIYKDLVRRREVARIAMNLDLQKEGLTFSIQNPATLPLESSGPRLMQFILGGFVLGIAFPIGLLYAGLQLRPRIRIPVLLAERTKLPVLSTVPHAWTPATLAAVRGEVARYIWVVAGTVAVVGFAGVLHLLMMRYG